MRNLQKFFTLTFVSTLTLTACSPTPTVVPITVPNNLTESVVATTPQQATPTIAPTAVIEASPTAASVPTVTGNLWLQVASPQDGGTVNTSQVDVTGSAPVSTVVSVNDDIIIVGDDQQFKSTVSLDEGPNLIEIVASDANGNETNLELTVVYEP